MFISVLFYQMLALFFQTNKLEGKCSKIITMKYPEHLAFHVVNILEK